MLAALLATTLSQAAAAAPLTPAGQRLAGPLDFCAEQFSIRLLAGEAVEWREFTPGTIGYKVRSGDHSAVVARRGTRIAASELTPLSLPLSPVTRRHAYAMPETRIVDERGNERRLVMHGLEYFLHGEAETERPLMVVDMRANRDPEMPFIDRIDPRPLAARGCTPSRTDPALASRIVHIPAGN